MKVLVLLFVLCISLPVAFADVYITEIMYNPHPFSDTDAEWVEIFNGGSDPVDLTDWKLNGNNFDDVVLLPQQYLVIARELVDGSDEDLESFSSAYSWNGSFLAVDGSMSLTDEGSVLLESSSGVEDFVNYSSSVGGKGNGHSIYLDDIWKEHPLVGGSPGRGEDSTIIVSFSIEEAVLALSNFSFADDLPIDGFQIIPSPGTTRQIYFEGLVDGDVTFGTIGFNSEVAELDVNSSGVFGSIVVPSSLAPGMYNISIHLQRESQVLEETISFEVMELVALELSSNSLDFGVLSQGESSSEQSITLSNIGNVLLDADIAASSFDGNSSLSSSIISVDSSALGDSQSFDLNLVPGSNRALNFSASIPVNASAGEYVGAISIVGRT